MTRFLSKVATSVEDLGSYGNPFENMHTPNEWTGGIDGGSECWQVYSASEYVYWSASIDCWDLLFLLSTLKNETFLKISKSAIKLYTEFLAST